MTSSLPPLRALQAFECFGRTGSVNAAARALGVTPGAISQQLRLLEEHLGVVLLVKDGRRAALTPAVREAMEELGVRPVDIRLCGTLDFFSAHNTFMIYPFVGVWQPGQEGCRLDPSNRGETADRLLVSAPDYRQWHFNRDEVAELFTVPLRHLLAQEPRVATSVVTMTHLDDFPYDLMPQTPKDWSRVRKYPIYFYTYQGRVIWGITASILHGFLERFRKGLVKFA